MMASVPQKGAAATGRRQRVLGGQADTPWAEREETGPPSRQSSPQETHRQKGRSTAGAGDTPPVVKRRYRCLSPPDGIYVPMLGKS